MIKAHISVNDNILMLLHTLCWRHWSAFEKTKQRNPMVEEIWRSAEGQSKREEGVELNERRLENSIMDVSITQFS